MTPAAWALIALLALAGTVVIVWATTKDTRFWRDLDDDRWDQ